MTPSNIPCTSTQPHMIGCFEHSDSTWLALVVIGKHSFISVLTLSHTATNSEPPTLYGVPVSALNHPRSLASLLHTSHIVVSQSHDTGNFRICTPSLYLQLVGHRRCRISPRWHHYVLAPSHMSQVIFQRIRGPDESKKYHGIVDV